MGFGVTDNCIWNFGVHVCCLGIPLFPYCLRSSERNAHGSVNGWQFRHKPHENSGNVEEAGRLYLVDVEKDTFTYYDGYGHLCKGFP